MNEALFDVHLTGHIQTGFTQASVVAQLAPLLKTTPEKATALVAGQPTRVKAGIPMAAAEKYRTALEQTGATVAIRPVIIRAPEPLDLNLKPEPQLEPVAFVAPVTAPVADVPASQPYSPPQPHNLHSGHTAFCSHCGGEIRRTAKVCPHCNGTIAQHGRSKNVAALLALLFTGSWGIHRFYLGQWWGIFYLLFCWTLIPSVVSLIEFFVFLFTNDEKWEEKYGHKGPSNVLVWVIPAVFIFVAMIGVLAAVAIPAYQDYLFRSQIQQTLQEAEPLELQIEEFINQTQTIPHSGPEMGLEESGEFTHASYRITENAVIELTFHGTSPDLDEQTLLLTPLDDAGTLIWDCSGGTVQDKLRPMACRE